MFCTKCGNQNPDGTKFCIKCGNPMEAQAQPQAEAPVQQPVQPVQQPVQQPVYQQPVQQPVYQQPMYQQPMYQKPAVPGKGLGITSMVLGIVALVFFCYWYISIPCGIIGLALGAVSLNKARACNLKNGLATAGLVCSCVAVGLAVLFILLVAAGLAELGML